MEEPEADSNLKPSLDSENEFSLVSLVEGDAFIKAVKHVPQELWQHDELQLKKFAKPTRTDYALKIALWNEFRLASQNNKSFKANRIYEGICSYQHWYHNVLNNHEKVAWLMSPMQDFERSLEPLLAVISERYNEIINMNVYDSKGRPDPALIKLVLKAMEMVEGRLLGGAVQRSENKSLSVNFQGPFDSSNEKKNFTMEELDQKLKELEERTRRSQPPPTIGPFIP